MSNASFLLADTLVQSESRTASFSSEERLAYCQKRNTVGTSQIIGAEVSATYTTGLKKKPASYL